MLLNGKYSISLNVQLSCQLHNHDNVQYVCMRHCIPCIFYCYSTLGDLVPSDFLLDSYSPMSRGCFQVTGSPSKHSNFT